MNKFVLKGLVTGLYFVKNQGFKAATTSLATKLSSEEAAMVQATGVNYGVEASEVIEVKASSFAVCYVRPHDIAGDGSIKQNNLNPSRRRFATREEANIHGRRFNERRAKGRNTEKGSAGHVGFYVIETNDPVNAAINPATGLTNKV